LPINIHLITTKAIEFRLLTETNVLHAPKLHIKVRWHKPPIGWFKLNIDVGFHKDMQKCGPGGVIKNAKGDWIVGYNKFAYANGCLQAEIKALQEGLKTAHEWGLFLLQIETDSTEVILSIQQGNNLYSNIIQKCRLLMHQQTHVTLQHEFRQGNKTAHQLAYMGIANTRKKKKVFVAPSGDVKFLVEHDVLEQCVLEKLLSYDACNTLASLGNQSILCDTNYKIHVMHVP